jgi:hypothetical protein
MLVKVCSVHPEHHYLKVHWWAATPLAYSKQQFFQLMAFAPAMDKVQIKTASAPGWHLHVLKEETARYYNLLILIFLLVNWISLYF